MENAVRTFEYRRRKDLSHRDIDISQTVFKVRFRLRITQFVKFHGEIRLVRSPASNTNPVALIQRIDQRLMDLPVQLHIERVQFNGLLKNVFKIIPDLRDRKSNDRKTPLLFLYISALYEGIISSVTHR